MTLRNSIVDVAKARHNADIANKEYHAAFGRWAAEHHELVSAVAETKSAMADAEQRLRECVLKSDPVEVKATEGVGVRQYTVLSYNISEAIQWAMERDSPQLLAINKKKFDAVAKALELDFVSIHKEPRPTIARDLSGWLGADEAMED